MASETQSSSAVQHVLYHLVSPVESDVAWKHGASRQNVLVAIPAYNEEVAIGSVILKAHKHAGRVIVINDGSTDRTAEIARLAGATVISHRTNEGKGAGIRDAFAFAKHTGTDILVLIDGDGQHDPEEIPRLIGPILEDDADFVNGSRFLEKKADGNNVPLHRRLGQEILTLATIIGTRRKITDTQNGFRAFSKKTFDCFSFRQNGMAIESEMLIDASAAGMRLKEVPITVRYDVKGSTHHPVTRGVAVLNRVIGPVLKNKHMLRYCMPGAGMMALGTFCVFMLMNGFNATHSLSLEYGLGSVLFIIPGLAMFSNGLMLNLLKIPE